MNCAGETMPNSLLSQRSRASTPVTRWREIDSRGWNTSDSSLRSIARRSALARMARWRFFSSIDSEYTW